MIVKNKLLTIITLAIIFNLVAGYYLILTTDQGFIGHIDYDVLSNSDTTNLQEETPPQNC